MKDEEMDSPIPLGEVAPMRTVNRRVRDEILVTIDEPINDQLDWSAHVETVGE